MGLSGDCEYTPRPPAVTAVLERRAFEKLHGDEGFPVLLADVVKCSDLAQKQVNATSGLTNWRMGGITGQSLPVFMASQV